MSWTPCNRIRVIRSRSRFTDETRTRVARSARVNNELRANYCPPCCDRGEGSPSTGRSRCRRRARDIIRRTDPGNRLEKRADETRSWRRPYRTTRPRTSGRHGPWKKSKPSRVFCDARLFCFYVRALAHLRRVFVVFRRSDLVCKVRYANMLPDIPFDLKFLSYPFSPTRSVHIVPAAFVVLGLFQQ